ncbi:MAG: hypothetical protein K0S25_69 [Bacillus sp. (in: firmicutes)]|nr:hypothetical protein [Bacillus sp. (in: firmicutes)]
MIKVMYAGYDITENLIVTSLDRGLLPEIEYNTKKVGRSDGEKYVDRTIGRRTIPMGFALVGNVNKKRHILAEIIAQKEPQPLIFSDEPDQLWYAIPTGDVGIDDIVRAGKGTINWVVPDGVSYDVNPRIFSNISIDSAENQVLDPEFRKKDKYYKQWTARLNETNGAHNILGADLSDTNTIADKGEVKYNGFYIMQNSNSTARNLPELKQGDKVWGRVALRIDKALQGDTNGSKSAVAVIQELDYAGGKVLASHEAKPAALNLDKFQNLDIQFSISNPNTKALNLITCLALGSAVSYSKMQFNLGEKLADYAEPTAQLADYVAVTNHGTYKSWPIIRATMNGENGLVGVVNQNDGILQFGTSEDVDIVKGTRTDKVLSANMEHNADKFEVNKGVPIYPYFLYDPATPNIIEGDIDWDTDPNGARPIFGPNKKEVWAGPTLYTPLAKNSANKANGDFLLRARLNFEATAKQRGRISLTLQSGDQAKLGVVVRDSSGVKSELIVEFWHNQTMIHSKTLDKKVWTWSFWEASIQKVNGTDITFKFSKWKSFSGEGIISSQDYIFPITIPELASTDITALNVWYQAWGGQEPAFMGCTDIKFYWNNETTITNIPNLFDDGDLLEIDVKERKIMLNGVENRKLHALGNTWERFAIEPGTTTVMPAVSSWANMCDFEVELRGAYI